jgi:putative nucleotidyltransferase with HDIG domain
MLYFHYVSMTILLPSRETTLALVEKYATSTKQHLLQVGAIMEHFAKKLGEDVDYWWTVGVLHDIDWDFVEKDGNRHLLKDFDTIADEIGLPSEIR